MYEKLLGFAMVLTRISAFLLLIPVFSWKTIPARIRIAAALLLAVFFSFITPLPTPDPVGGKQFNWLQAVLLLTNEATYGLALGLVITVMFSAVRFAGQAIEQQMGLAMAQVLDPLTDESSDPLSNLLEIIFIVLFISANGHHLFLLVINRSYEAFPAGSIPTITVLAGGIIKAGSTMLMAGLRLAGPMLAGFVLLIVTLALLARTVPEMNILFISLPVQTGLGLFMAVTFLPFIKGFVAEFADWMGKLLPL